MLLMGHSGRLKDTRDACDTQFASQQSAISALEALGVEMAELAEHHRVTEVRCFKDPKSLGNVCNSSKRRASKEYCRTT